MRGVTGHDKHHSMDVLSLFAIVSATCRGACAARVRAIFLHAHPLEGTDSRCLTHGRWAGRWRRGTRLFLFFKKGARQAAHCRP
jgi:hypothetical protein